MTTSTVSRHSSNFSLRPFLEMLRIKLIVADPLARAEDIRERLDGAATEMLMMGRDLEQTWAKFFEIALRGGAAMLQPDRDVYVQFGPQAATYLRELAQVARECRHDPAAVASWESAADHIDKRFSYLAERWKTVEDLEYLAAETLAPSQERFDALRNSLPYPQAWYDQDSKPW